MRRRILLVCLAVMMLCCTAACHGRVNASLAVSDFFTSMNQVFSSDLKQSDFTGADGTFTHIDLINDHAREEIYLNVQNGRVESVTVICAFDEAGQDVFVNVNGYTHSAAEIRSFLDLADYRADPVQIACMEAVSRVYLDWPRVFVPTLTDDQMNALIQDGSCRLGDWEFRVNTTMGTISIEIQ